MGQQVYIHVGYPKAASTTLQHNLFGKHPSIQDLTLYTHNQFNPYHLREHFINFYRNIQNCNVEEYKNSNTFQIYNQYIIPSLSQQKINVFSTEGFIIGNVKQKAARLKELFPNAKIIIMIRNQASLIKSLFYFLNGRFVVRNKDNKTILKDYQFTNLYEWMEFNLANYQNSYLKELNYYQNIKVYEDLFGKDNIGIFLVEKLTQNRENFAEELAHFLNIDAEHTKQFLQLDSKNSSDLGKLSLFIKKFLPGIKFSQIVPDSAYYKIKNIIKNKLPQKIPEDKMSSKHLNKLYEMYSQDNQKLDTFYNLDLSKYGYLI